MLLYNEGEGGVIVRENYCSGGKSVIVGFECCGGELSLLSNWCIGGGLECGKGCIGRYYLRGVLGWVGGVR